MASEVENISQPDRQTETGLNQKTIEIPIEGLILIASALEAAALDINQASAWRPDQDSQRALDQINMALALLAHDRRELPNPAARIDELWYVIALTENVLADYGTALKKGYVSVVKAKVFALMDQKRQWQ